MTDNSQNIKDASELTAPQELTGKTLGVVRHPMSEQNEDAPSKLSPEVSALSDSLNSFAQHTHSYLREYIALADQKAAFVFAVGAGLLVYLYEKSTSQMWLKSIKEWSLMDAISFIAIFGLAASCVMAIAVVFPKLKGSRRGHIFWSGISEFDTSSEYANSVANLTEASIVDETLKHNYELSSICKRKYSILNISLISGAVGAVFAILFLVFG